MENYDFVFSNFPYIGMIIIIYLNKICLWNTMPPIMANFNEGQDHKDKYFDTSRMILSQEMTMCNMEALVSYFYAPLEKGGILFCNCRSVGRSVGRYVCRSVGL